MSPRIVNIFFVNLFHVVLLFGLINVINLVLKMARVNSIEFHKEEKSVASLNVSLNVSNERVTQPKDKNIYFDDPDLYPVERIVKRRTRKRKIDYLLKWEGYPDADNSWENEANVTPDLIIAFENERKISARKAVAAKRKIEHDLWNEAQIPPLKKLCEEALNDPLTKVLIAVPVDHSV